MSLVCERSPRAAPTPYPSGINQACTQRVRGASARPINHTKLAAVHMHGMRGLHAHWVRQIDELPDMSRTGGNRLFRRDVAHRKTAASEEPLHPLKRQFHAAVLCVGALRPRRVERRQAFGDAEAGPFRPRVRRVITRSGAPFGTFDPPPIINLIAPLIGPPLMPIMPPGPASASTNARLSRCTSVPSASRSDPATGPSVGREPA
jgi:hypothetical protein